MGRLVINDGASAPRTEFPAIHGVSARGVRSTALVSGRDRPLHCWSHDIDAGGEIRLEQTDVGHAFFVERGRIAVDGRDVPAGRSVVFGSKARNAIRTADEPARILHFFAAEATHPKREGGCIHFGNAAPLVDQANNTAHTLFADASCPACELWLHRSEFRSPGYFVRPHFHTEDEIIVVIAGDIVLGDRSYPAGTALAIDEHAVYSFRAGPSGLAFVNFRDGEPFFVPKAGPGSDTSFSERQMFEDLRVRLQAT